MEVSSFTSSVELGMDDPLFFNQWPLNSFPFDSAFFEDVHQYSYSQQEVMDFKRPAESSHEFEANRLLKQLKTDTTFTSCQNENLSNSSSFQLANSGFTIVKPEQETWSPSSTLSFPSESLMKQTFTPNTYQQGTDNISTSTRLAQSQEHILAERKRREKLSQRFIALSVLVPGLKKTDKASVLGDAIEYMKKLKEKVKILEEQTKKNNTMESVVFVKKYELQSDDQDSSSDESIGPIATETLPQVEARFCNQDILIHIHCQKTKGTLEKIVVEIEKLHLSVVNSSVMTFGDSTLDITIIAQKDEEFTLNMKKFVTKLRSALETFM